MPETITQFTRETAPKYGDSRITYQDIACGELWETDSYRQALLIDGAEIFAWCDEDGDPLLTTQQIYDAWIKSLDASSSKPFITTQDVPAYGCDRIEFKSSEHFEDPSTGELLAHASQFILVDGHKVFDTDVPWNPVDQCDEPYTEAALYALWVSHLPSEPYTVETAPDYNHSSVYLLVQPDHADVFINKCLVGSVACDVSAGTAGKGIYQLWLDTLETEATA